MCDFFSLCSDGRGKVLYFDADKRRKIEGTCYYPDSHTSVADYHGYKGAAEDKLNKWEYNPITKILTADQINTNDDTVFVQEFCDNLDFKTIVPELVVKPIINPLLVRKHKVTKKDIIDLEKWAGVMASIGDSAVVCVWDRVGYIVDSSVMASFGNSSVWDIVWDSVWDSVWDIVWDRVVNRVVKSMVNSVVNSVRDSVRDSVYGYISSFFDIEYDHDFYPAVRLWERGFVPSFDGDIWRLHQGKDAEIVFEMEKED